MMEPGLSEYGVLAGRYDVVPVSQEFLADRETPVSVLQRFLGRPNAFLLESMEGGETWGRYSFVGVDPEPLLDVPHDGTPTAAQLADLRTVYQGLRVAPLPGLPRFVGGAVGYLGYEAVREFERLPVPKPADFGTACRSRFLRADCMIVFDNIRHTARVVVCSRPATAASPAAAYEAAKAKIHAVRDILARPSPPSPEGGTAAAFESNMSPEQFKSMVAKAKEYIRAGDIIQVVLSQRFSAPTAIHPFQMYRALRLLNPSPYTFYLQMGDETLVGSSPEVMVRLTGNRVELRPIAGTRPRGKDEQEDRRFADDLLADEKERAEHVMLVDLGRNDIGRVAELGSVQVSDYMVVERYSHVMHLVSHVQGVLRKEFDAYDVLRATFPAGTLTGAPKIRAMEIVHELEPEPRGVYGGAVGYVGYDGNMDMAITIRTLRVANGRVSVQAGAGVVYDSDPEREFQETCHKARGMRLAVELAARNLDLSEVRP